jgi:hypothetical protein
MSPTRLMAALAAVAERRAGTLQLHDDWANALVEVALELAEGDLAAARLAAVKACDLEIDISGDCATTAEYLRADGRIDPDTLE